MEDRVADLRARWTPEATAAAVAFLESRPTSLELPTMEHAGETYLDLRGLRIESTQVDRALLRNVNLRWAVFSDVGFKNARFVNCNLSQVQFHDCYLRRAQFEKCDIVNSHFESCDFSQASIVDCRIDFASFKDCEISLDAIRFPADTTARAMVRVCRNLKLNAMSMGTFRDAGELAYLEKFHERRGYWHDRQWARWLGSAVQNLMWGYGERPWRLALVMAFFIVFFGTLFHVLDPLPGKTWWEHVYFAGITYLTVGYGDLAPISPFAQLLSLICAASGIGTFGLLIASVTKKVMYR